MLHVHTSSSSASFCCFLSTSNVTYQYCTMIEELSTSISSHLLCLSFASTSEEICLSPQKAEERAQKLHACVQYE